MKLPLLFALVALPLTGCEKVIFSADATPAPVVPTPAPVVTTTTATPAPKAGAWMKDSKSNLDKSGELGAKVRK